MPFIVDLLPPAADIEAAAALGLAMAERKSKGLFGRKQYEPIEVVARFALPLRTVTWTPGETTGRCLVFNPQGLVSGSIRFDLSPDIPETDLDPEAGEEAFLDLCQGWTKAATEFTPSTLEFPGLIAVPEQVATLLDGAQEQLLVDWEEKADSDGALQQLTDQLQAYTRAAQAWSELKQKAYAHRDILADKIQKWAEEERVAGEQSLADLTSQVETAIATRRAEADAALKAVQEEYQKRKDMLQEELNRFQEGFKESGDNYWRDQIKTAEKSMAENEKWFAKKRQELEDSYKEAEKQQQAKIREFQSELNKRLEAFALRQKRLDAALEGFSKGLERRLALYQQQPERVLAATLELSTQRAAQAHNAVFYAARYPGGRWLVFPPQVMGSRGILGAVSGLFGGLNLPFKPASKLAETLAERLQRQLPGTDLEGRLVEANLMEAEEFFVQAKAGLVKLIDQGKLDKKHANLFAEFDKPVEAETEPLQPEEGTEVVEEPPSPDSEPVAAEPSAPAAEQGEEPARPDEAGDEGEVSPAGDEEAVPPAAAPEETP